MDPYAELFTNRPSKVFALIYSTVVTLVFTPVMYSIVRFERNHHHRTLINQLMASTFWTAIIWNLAVQPLAIYRFIFGPVHPEFICRVNSILRNALPMHGLLLLDAIMAVKYAFLFHTKNPTAVQDDFWNIFLNIWTFAFTSISQIIYILSPGQTAQNFFICIGKHPTTEEWPFPKKNYPVVVVLVVSALIYLFVGIRNLHYKYCVNSDNKNSSNAGISIFNLPLNTQTLVSFTTHGVVILLLSSCFLVLVKVNNMTFEMLSSFPNYFWFYILHLYSTSSTVAATVIVYFIKSNTIYNHVKMECTEILTTMFHSNIFSNRIYDITN